jgi:probable phosphoglycerate mutase
MANPASEVVLVRHGETEWSRSGQHTGRMDIGLTDLGRRQAAMAAEALEGRQFATVLSSPLSRARETCEIAGLSDRAERRDDLMEWHYGDMEGRTTAERRRDVPGWTIWRDGVDGGETLDAVAGRADRVVAELRERASDGDAVVFAHGHLLRVLAARWIGQPPLVAANLKLSTATISVLGYERETPAIVEWNISAHLARLT